MPNNPSDEIEYIKVLLGDAREELSRADSKSALLLAAAGVVVGALLGGMLGGKWNPLEIDGGIQWLWWLGVAAAAMGIGSIAAAVYPRIRRSGIVRPAAPAYYGDVAQYKDVREFQDAIKGAANLDLGARLIDQAYQVSCIVQGKYLLLRRGLLLFLFASAACTAALLLNMALRK